MRIIVDPYREGCAFITDSFMHTIKGCPAECCDWLLKRVLDPRAEHRQIHDISLDTYGIGLFYADALNKAGVVFEKLRKMNNMDLPVLCED